MSVHLIVYPPSAPPTPEEVVERLRTEGIEAVWTGRSSSDHGEGWRSGDLSAGSERVHASAQELSETARRELVDYAAEKSAELASVVEQSTLGVRVSAGDRTPLLLAVAAAFANLAGGIIEDAGSGELLRPDELAPGA